MDDISGIARALVDPVTITTILCSLLAIWILWKTVRRDEEKSFAFTVEVPEQCVPGWTGKRLERPTIKVSGSDTIQCYAPATGQFLGFVNPTTPDGVDRTIAKAAEAQLQWAETSFGQRRRVLRTLLKFVLDNQEPIARAACLDSGKTRVDAVFGEILVTAAKLKWTINHGQKALQTESRPRDFLMFYKHNEVRYEPLGTVGACVSWNYPFHNFIGPVISALFAGNAIVVKTSEQTAWSSAYFLNIVRSALAACGHDPNLVHAISCWPQTASYFAGHQDISHLTFIGSKPVAHEVAKSASKSLTPLCVELGGKDAALILDEPNNQPETPDEIQRVLSILMRGIFQSAGQNCIGIERVVAMPQAHSRLSPLLASRIKRLRVGCDLDKQSDAKAVDVGAMISSASFDRLERLIDEAVAQGAKLVAGGRRFQHEKYPSAHYFEPTMLTDVTETMRIAQEELFAPICLLMQAETVTDAIRIANATNYGLACCVFGPTSSSKARTRLEEVVSAMKTGMVAVNDFAVTYPVQLPFGGVKASGYGRFAGEEGLRSLCNLKSVCSDRWPFAIKTTIPRALDYPMGPYASHAARGVVELGYGQGLKRKFDGIKAVLWYSSGS